MNVDIFAWSVSQGSRWEFPVGNSLRETYARLSSPIYAETGILHLSVERSGDVICYHFFRHWMAQSLYAGISILVNGFAVTDLDTLAELVDERLQSLPSLLAQPDESKVRARLSLIFDMLRDSLCNQSDRYGLRSLAPVDYSTESDYFLSFIWGEATPDEIVRSTEKGLTHVAFCDYLEEISVDPTISSLDRPQPSYPEVSEPAEVPDDYFVKSILVTLFCCTPVGIGAIVNAIKCRRELNNGNLAKAKGYAKAAKDWVIVGFILGIPVWISTLMRLSRAM